VLHAARRRVVPKNDNTEQPVNTALQQLIYLACWLGQLEDLSAACRLAFLKKAPGAVVPKHDNTEQPVKTALQAQIYPVGWRGLLIST
jgi:hypothetical protein